MVSVPRQSLQLMSGCHIPDLYGLIPTAGSQPSAIGAESKAGDQIPVAFQRVDLAAGGDVPELYALISARGGEPTAVRAEGNRVDLFLVPLEFPYFTPRR